MRPPQPAELLASSQAEQALFARRFPAYDTEGTAFQAVTSIAGQTSKKVATIALGSDIEKATLLGEISAVIQPAEQSRILVVTSEKAAPNMLHGDPAKVIKRIAPNHIVGTPYNHRQASLPPPDIIVVEEPKLDLALRSARFPLKQVGFVFYDLGDSLPSQATTKVFKDQVAGPQIALVTNSVDGERFSGTTADAIRRGSVNGIQPFTFRTILEQPFGTGKQAESTLHLEYEYNQQVVDATTQLVAQGKQVAVYCKDSRHAAILTALLQARSLSAAEVNTRRPLRENTEIIKQFTGREINVLVGMSMLEGGHGIFPEALVIACRTRDEPTMQRLLANCSAPNPSHPITTVLEFLPLTNGDRRRILSIRNALGETAIRQGCVIGGYVDVTPSASNMQTVTFSNELQTHLDELEGTLVSNATLAHTSKQRLEKRIAAVPALPGEMTRRDIARCLGVKQRRIDQAIEKASVAILEERLNPHGGRTDQFLTAESVRAVVALIAPNLPTAEPDELTPERLSRIIGRSRGFILRAMETQGLQGRPKWASDKNGCFRFLTTEQTSLLIHLHLTSAQEKQPIEVAEPTDIEMPTIAAYPEFANLPAKDSLSALNAIARENPLLNKEEQIMLLKRLEAGIYAQGLLDSSQPDKKELMVHGKPVLRSELEILASEGDAARKRFIRANIRLAFWAGKHVPLWPSRPYVEKVEAALETIIRIIPAYDYKLGSFSTFAVKSIGNDYVRLGSSILTEAGLRGLVRPIRDMTIAEQSLAARLGRPPSTKETADELDTSEERVLLLKHQYREALYPQSKDEVFPNGNPVLEIADKKEEYGPVLAKQMVHQLLQRCSGLLDQTQIEIIGSRFGLNGQKEQTNEQIAENLEIKVSQVGLEFRKAMTILREEAAELGFEP